MQKLILHITILGISIFLTFLWVTTEETSYLSLQLTAVLMLTLLLTRHFLKPPSFRLMESTVSTMAVLLIASSTGGITSPFFFLNYFLLFELSLLLEPAIPLFLSVALILFYLTTSATNTSFFNWMELAAFPFMTPLSYIFGKIYQKEENQKKEIKKLNHKIEELEEEMEEEEISNVSNFSKSVTTVTRKK